MNNRAGGTKSAGRQLGKDGLDDRIRLILGQQLVVVCLPDPHTCHGRSLAEERLATCEQPHLAPGAKDQTQRLNWDGELSGPEVAAQGRARQVPGARRSPVPRKLATAKAITMALDVTLSTAKRAGTVLLMSTALASAMTGATAETASQRCPGGTRWAFCRSRTRLPPEIRARHHSVRLGSGGRPAASWEAGRGQIRALSEPPALVCAG